MEMENAVGLVLGGDTAEFNEEPHPYKAASALNASKTTVLRVPMLFLLLKFRSTFSALGGFGLPGSLLR